MTIRIVRTCALLSCVHVGLAFRINRGDAGTISNSNGSENKSTSLHSASEIKRLVAESYAVPPTIGQNEKATPTPKKSSTYSDVKHAQRPRAKGSEEIEDDVSGKVRSFNETFNALYEKALSFIRLADKAHTLTEQKKASPGSSDSHFGAIGSLIPGCAIACFAMLWYCGMCGGSSHENPQAARARAAFAAENAVGSSHKSVSNPYGSYVTAPPGQRQTSVPYAKAGADNASSSSQSYAGLKPDQHAPFDDLVRNESAAFAAGSSSDEASKAAEPQNAATSEGRRKSAPYAKGVRTIFDRKDVAESEPQRSDKKSRTAPFGMKVPDGSQKVEPEKKAEEAGKKTERRPSVPYASFWRVDP